MLNLAKRYWTAVGFASVPGSTEEVRAFLQKRVVLFVGFSFALWSLVLVGLVTIHVTFGTDANASPAGLVAHVGGALVLGAMWLGARRTELGLFALNVLDSATVKLQVAGLCLLLYLARGDLPLRPELSVLIGLACILNIRATIVPSTWVRTLAIGGGTMFALLCVTYWVYHESTETLPLPANAYVLWSGLMCALNLMSSVFISHVMYALRRRAQEALSLGQYVLEGRLGEGGMGVVYRGRHAMLRRPTAIKLLPPDRAGAESVMRFEREVRVTSQLTHPNTVAIYDYGRTPEGTFYYAMEYLEGIDLEELVASDGPQPAARVRHVLAQIAGALAEAHDAGVIHRDIKPANVMLCERGRVRDFVKVLDFGLVRETKSQTAALSDVNVIMGTPLYMSPEQVRDPGRIDGKSDLYALGAVGYYLLAGVPLFDGETAVEVCAHHLHSPVVGIEERSGIAVPADLEALVRRCLEKDPGRRPENAAAVAEALAACDVGAWSPRDAETWWKARSGQVKKVRRRRSDGPGTLAVDLAARSPAKPLTAA